MEENKNWQKIKDSNDLIKTIELKGKDYAEVKERVIAFRRVHPLGQIITELSFTDNYVNCEAMIFDENDKLLSKGHAREYLKNDSAIEKCETSSIGRGLGFSGYGIATSIASAEDIENVGKSEIFDEIPKTELLKEYSRKFTKQEQVDFQNAIHVVNAENISSNLLKAMIEFKDEQVQKC